MRIIITTDQLKKILSEQTSSFETYMKDLVNNPPQFLSKLNSDPKFKQEYIKSYNSNTDQNFDIIENSKIMYALKFGPLTGYIRDMGVDPPTTEEHKIANLNDYNNFSQLIKQERSKGRKLTGFVQSSIKNLEGGKEFAEAANIALGQRYF